MLTGRMDESCQNGSEDRHCTLPETNFPFRKDMANLGWLGDVPSFFLTVLFGRLSLWPATFTGFISFIFIPPLRICRHLVDVVTWHTCTLDLQYMNMRCPLKNSCPNRI